MRKWLTPYRRYKILMSLAMIVLAVEVIIEGGGPFEVTMLSLLVGFIWCI